METIKTQARVGKDGLLRLEVPLDLRDVDLEVLLVVHPLTSGQGSRDECFFVVKRRCFTEREAACRAARCGAKRCVVEGGGPATVRCQ